MITVKNKIQVLRGNKIILPGCEPISAFTSPTLAANWDCPCSAISLDVALEVVPGSYLEWMNNPKTLYFVLPDGPPPSPEGCDTPCVRSVSDWYQVLRDAADCNVEEETTSTSSCQNIYNYRGCGL